MVQIFRPSRPSRAHPRAIEGGGGREALEDAAARVADTAHPRAVGVAQVELGHRGRWVALTSYSGLSWKEKKKQESFSFLFFMWVTSSLSAVHHATALLGDGEA